MPRSRIRNNIRRRFSLTVDTAQYLRRTTIANDATPRARDDAPLVDVGVGVGADGDVIDRRRAEASLLSVAVTRRSRRSAGGTDEGGGGERRWNHRRRSGGGKHHPNKILSPNVP